MPLLACFELSLILGLGSLSNLLSYLLVGMSPLLGLPEHFGLMRAALSSTS